jgi:hypothetical protein
MAAVLPGAASAQTAAHPLRGLWIGQATLNYVTEVSVPLDL